MKFATSKFPKHPVRSKLPDLESSGFHWVQFGRDVLVYGPAARWRAMVGRLGDAARGLEAPEGDVRKNRMHLVVQKGRTFQLENPDVRIILDKGRFLVVELPRAEARKLAGRRDPCFRVEPLRENSIVFDERAPVARAVEADAHVESLVAGLSQPNFEAALAHLVAIPTRLSTGPGYAAAASWMRDELAGLGLSTSLEPVTVGAAQSSNVVATKPGSGGPGRQHLLVVAHLDSINHPGGASAPAPGADDNASGSAGVLALARAMAGHEFEHDVSFILFGGEEQGLNGSTQYVSALSATERQRIRGVVNMDMIGSVNSQPPAVLLEGAALSQAMIDGLAGAAAQFTGLAVQTSLNPFASDHVPFIQQGIPAVLTIEGADGANDAIHTANDTLDRVDPGFAMEILRMNCGYLAAEAGLVSQQPGTQPQHQPTSQPIPQPVQPQPQPVPQPAGCGCGCTGTADPALAQAVNQLSAHYQALFAQYARLNRDGAIQAQDLANWQSARLAYEQLIAGSGLSQLPGE